MDFEINDKDVGALVNALETIKRLTNDTTGGFIPLGVYETASTALALFWSKKEGYKLDRKDMLKGLLRDLENSDHSMGYSESRVWDIDTGPYDDEGYLGTVYLSVTGHTTFDPMTSKAISWVSSIMREWLTKYGLRPIGTVRITAQKNKINFQITALEGE
tara:strand:+ start:339 stop:818 length:480 start_codon:yes stop_codon:yes gene_type:complete